MASTIWPGRLRRSRSGVSSESSRPSCSSATRWQRSASSRYGVLTRIVMPCSRNSASSFQNSRRETGSTPVVGSSSRMTRGSCTSVQASASFCFIPPESRSARRDRNGSRFVSSSSRRRRSLVVREVVDLGKERDVLVDAQVAIQAEALRQVADGSRDRGVFAHRDRAPGRAPIRRRRAATRTAGESSSSCPRRRARSGRTSRRVARRRTRRTPP